jgi:transcriptional regulator with XRE-family HTH domain
MNQRDNFSQRQIEELDQIGSKLKALRIQKGYSNYEIFAFDNGLNRVNYGRYEKGNNMRLDTLIKILECHNLTLAEFFLLK